MLLVNPIAKGMGYEGKYTFGHAGNLGTHTAGAHFATMKDIK